MREGTIGSAHGKTGGENLNAGVGSTRGTCGASVVTDDAFFPRLGRSGFVGNTFAK